MINFQLVRFGIVGITAMGVHMLSVLMLVSFFNMLPLVANVLAFLIAFQISYFGHARWTFNVNDPNSNKHKMRFFAVAVLSFAVNEAAYSILLNVFNIDYRLALIVVLFSVAVITFVLSRLWAFRE